MSKALKIFCLWLSCFAFSASVDASGTITLEKNYLVPESKLIALETRFSKLKSINLQLEKDWLSQQKKLESLEQKSLTLKSKLLTALEESEKQEESLMKLNQSFKEYAEETKKKLKKEKDEKHLWMGVAFLFGGIAISK